MSGEWYLRQFGDTDQFALHLSFGRDPDGSADASWGRLGLWAGGRCLTRNRASGATSDHVNWSLREILSWLGRTGARMVNEEPLPLIVADDRVPDACGWLDASEDPFPTPTREEESRWFERRSEWRNHHAVRAAALDVALPNVLIRRLGQFLEVSWDNETWSAPRADLTFLEGRGRELVDARATTAVLQEALRDASAALEGRSGGRALLAAVSVPPSDTDWRWLVHGETADIIQRALPELASRLATHAREQRQGWFVPHCTETLALRQARLRSAEAIRSLLSHASPPSTPMSDRLRSLIRPQPARSVQPWLQGYEQAEHVRAALDLGDRPLVPLPAWLQSHGIEPVEADLDPSVSVLAARSSASGKTVVNRSGESRLRKEIGHAAALGHILFDPFHAPTDVALEGQAEDWPTAARARAFGVMLLLPDAGVRETLGPGPVDAEGVARVMQRFGVGPHATTFHLRNRHIISEERRMDLLREVAA